MHVLYVWSLCFPHHSNCQQKLHSPPFKPSRPRNHFVCNAAFISYGCLQHTASERTFAVLEKKGKIRAGQDGMSTGRAEALEFVCELKTGGTKSLCAPVHRLGAKVSLKFGIRISLRCQVVAVRNVRLCYLATLTLRRNIGVGETCSSIYGDYVVTFSILRN
jgi:hypothetical protein